MSGEFHLSSELTTQQLEALANISQVAIDLGLVTRYSQALKVYGEYYKDAKPFLGDTTDPNDPTYRLKRAVLGPQPISSPLETFFAALISYGHGGDEDPDTNFYLAQVDSVYGEEIEGSSIFVGTVDPVTWTPRINDAYAGIFTENDIGTVMDFIIVQEREGISTDHKF
jgi:hypothetical protein